MENLIKKICKEEYNLYINLWDKEDTVWINLPLEDIVDKNTKEFSKDALDKRRIIFTSLMRVVLSMDKPPKFYVIVISDIKAGIDIYYVGHLQDLIKFNMQAIPENELTERTLFFPFYSQQIIDDKEGKHLTPYNITIGEFISYLVKQAMEKKFTSPQLKDSFKIEEINTYFKDGRLSLNFRIIPQDNKNYSLPFEESKKILKKFLEIYELPSEILEIEINDSGSGKIKIYSKGSIMQMK